MPTASSASPAGSRPPRAPAFVLGLGLGAFLDGILLHQVLQWHHMVSSTEGHPATTVPGLEANVLADGLFHVVAWLLVAAGIGMVVRAWQRGRLPPPWRVHGGMALAGWGAFDLADGVVNHHLLGVHHVRDDLGGPLGWDLGFLALGAVLLAGGLWLARGGGRTA